MPRNFMGRPVATGALDIGTPIALRLVVLTACRKNELVGARQGEFDLAARAKERLGQLRAICQRGALTGCIEQS